MKIIMLIKYFFNNSKNKKRVRKN